jgi:hypothetical protein
MCSTPSIPTTPQRQAVQLPDGGAPAAADNATIWQRTVMAGMVTGPQGVLGNPNVGKSTLG